MSRSFNGRLARPGILDRGSAAMRADLYETVTTRRAVAGIETRVSTFQARIAATSASAAGRDALSVPGNAAARMFVALAPRWADVEKDDELWSGVTRYRVIAVDDYPHGRQALIQEIQ